MAQGLGVLQQLLHPPRAPTLEAAWFDAGSKETRMRASPQAAGPGEVRLHSPTGRAVVAAAVLYALPVFVTLMFIVGSQDAFDLLGTSLGVRLKGELFQDSAEDAMGINDEVAPPGSEPVSDADRRARRLTS
jgi:hypothetical protein